MATVAEAAGKEIEKSNEDVLAEYAANLKERLDAEGQERPKEYLPYLQTISHWGKALMMGTLAQIALRVSRYGLATEGRTNLAATVRGRTLLADMAAIGGPHFLTKFIQAKNPTAHWPSTLFNPLLTGVSMYAVHGRDVASGLLGSGMAFLTARWGVTDWKVGIDAAINDIFNTEILDQEAASYERQTGVLDEDTRQRQNELLTTKSNMEQLARSTLAEKVIAQEGFVRLDGYRLANLSTVSEQWGPVAQYNPGKSAMFFKDFAAVEAYARSHAYVAFQVKYSAEDDDSFERVEFLAVRAWNDWSSSRSGPTELLEKGPHTKNWMLGVLPPLYRKMMSGSQVSILEASQRLQA